MRPTRRCGTPRPQLNQGQDQAAGQSQQQAIAALQKGNKEMGQAHGEDGPAARPGPSQDGEGEDGDGRLRRHDGHDDARRPARRRPRQRPDPGSADRADPGGRDPLGRYNQGNSTDNADVAVPEERERQRTQAIQEELRRAARTRNGPRQELDYIGRLLKQF